jgi:hypothetical protein
MTQSKTVDSKKPQDAKQVALLEQLRKVSGGWTSDPWGGSHKGPIIGY